MSSVYAQCPTCKLQVPGPTQAQANRNLGLHRRSKHGYRSPKYEEHQQYRTNAKLKAAQVSGLTTTQQRLDQLAAARDARWGKRPVSQTPAAKLKRTLTYKSAEERRQQKLAYGAAYRERQKKLKAAGPAPDAAVLCKLSECPQCGARFYVVRGQQGE